MVVMLDFDDVIYPCSQDSVNMANFLYSTNYKIEDIKEYFKAPKEVELCFPLIPYKMENKDNSIEYVKELIKEHDVYILTASLLDNLKDKMNWIETNLPEIGWSKTIVGKNKHLIKCDVLVDDAYHNLEGNNIKYKFLMNMPHNANIKESKDIIRVNNLKEVIEYLKSS